MFACCLLLVYHKKLTIDVCFEPETDTVYDTLHRCPHCQNYKWDYVEIAAEVQRRSVSPGMHTTFFLVCINGVYVCMYSILILVLSLPTVQFHAVSCDVYYAICATYEIRGFPTILGWKQGESKSYRGLEMNEEEDIEPETVGEMLGIDLAHEALELFDWEFEDEEMKAKVQQKLDEQARKAARVKKSWHEHEPHTHNDRYHNAALSLAFAVKSQLFQTVTEDGKIEPKRKDAFVDFLNLLDWATPQSWNLRTNFLKEMQWKMKDSIINNRGDVEKLINGDQHRHRAKGTVDVWGHVDESEITWTGKVFGGKSQEDLAKDDTHWSKTCTHSQPAKGFTCGLW